jgi:glycolate oxidase iron-sulfur subunit
MLQGIHVPDEEQYRACSRCGLCLSICPTYRLTWRETDSPRARLMMLRKVLEGELDISPGFNDEMYRCLDCLACNAICPVGIKPGDLVLAARYMIHEARPQPWIQSLIFGGYFPNPALMQISMLPLLLYQRLGVQHAANALGITQHFPEQLRDLERLLPPLPKRPLRSHLPEVTPVRGERKYRVGFFLGCFQNMIFADASAATVRVLAHNGCEVVTPKNVKCCGMPHLAYGEVETARLLARHNIDILEKLDADVILTDCATCGSSLKEYGAHLLAEDAEYSGRARALSGKVRDISEFLGEIPLRHPEHPQNMRVTYHDPCHLRRGQNVWREPRQLLQLAGAEFVELREADWCCGSAGTQMITHYENSMRILARKIQNVAETGAAILATGCPGCQLQLGLGAQRAGLNISVKHPVQILDQAYQ